MKKKEPKILYYFILFIVLIGILSFIFRGQLAGKFLHYDYLSPVVTPTNTPDDTLKLDLLSNEKIKSLKDSVTIFNYEDLNKTQDLLEEQFRTNSASAPDLYDEEGQLLPKKAFFRVSVGNSNPFSSEKKK
jgi:hypothetical protein